MKVVVFTGTYLPGFKGGGPIKTIKNLITETGDLITYKVITSDRDLGDNLPYKEVKFGAWNSSNNSEVYYIQPGPKGIRQIVNLMIKTKYDVVYLNSFFSPKFSLLPLLLSRALKKQVVLGPRGEFSEGALKLKNTKKHTFINIYRLMGLTKNIVFQASSKYEAEDIREVLGSEVDIAIAEDIASQEFVESIPIRNNEVTKAVFLSRISPMKNLILALEVLKRVKSSLVYDIYGPIEDESYWQRCQNVIADLPSNITVQYKGELTPEQVVPKLLFYDFFFMPTKGENYSHVIAEALCAGLPLLISDATPWRNLSEQGLGWDLPLDNPSAFSTAINNLALMNEDDHHEIRKNILKWARNRFSQRDAIEANIAMFEYAANK